MNITGSNTFLVDQNLARNLCRLLKDPTCECVHVADIGLAHADDREVWQYAKKNSCCILTKDSDFKFMSIVRGCPPKVVRLNCGNKNSAFIQELILREVETIKQFLTDPDSCYLEI